MDLTLTKDQQLIADTAAEVLAGQDRGAADDPLGYSPALWRQMVELGWPGLALPEKYGGVGLGFLELCLLIEQLGAAALPAPLLTTAACCGEPIARYGTAAQKSEWLAAIADGRILSYAPPGSPLTLDGDTLTGTAQFVPYAGAAEALLVVAADGDGQTAVLVDTAGLDRQPVEVVGPGRPCHVTFPAVRVPAGRVLGAGAPVAAALAAYGAAATCAEMVGGAQAVLDLTVEYARTREQFGRPIGTFQAVQHHCADMAIDVLASRLVAYEAIWCLSTGRDATREVATAKSWVSEAYQRVCALGHQVHGAIGFTAEHDLHRYLRHALTAALAFGDTDTHLDHLARDLGL
jgi:alkylation response protein AidB-like acyl-CoA dehydrogenase